MNYRNLRIVLGLIAVMSSLAVPGVAQQASTGGTSTTTGANSAVVPQLVNYSGVLTDIDGKPLTNLVGVTFTLYQESEGGTPLWMEIQNVQPTKSGHYSVMLGSTTSAGLPQDVFVNGEARWLGVRVEGQAEQPRTLLVAVPYALKAGDAETIGGLPASAFVLANGSQSTAKAGASAGTSAANPATAKNSAAPANPAVTGKGTADYIPMWDSASDIVNSAIFQKSSAIGIGTTTPAATLDVNGKTDVRDTLTLVPKSTDNTLAVSGTTFKLDSTGKVTFIAGQTFPGAGTITGVTTATGSGLSGGGTTGTLSLKVPAAGITNAMLANSKITLNASAAGGLTVPGAMTLGNTYTVGLKTCAANQVLQYNGTAWACASAGTGTVTSVGSGAGLAGGPITGSGTLSIASAGVTNTMLQNSKVTLNASTAGGLTVPGAMTLGNTYTMGLKTCAANQVLEYVSNAWTCENAGTGTVTSVATGLGLTGGPITGSGTVSIDATVVPQLAAANNFVNTQSINVNTSGDGLDVTSLLGFGGSFTSGSIGDAVYGVGGLGGYFSGDFNGIASYSTIDSDSAIGVYGDGGGSDAETIGVMGRSTSVVGVGTYGAGGDSSSQSGTMLAGFFPLGVWGDTGLQGGMGVFGSEDDGYSFIGYNNSRTGYATALFQNDDNTTSSNAVLVTYGGGFGDLCIANEAGDFSCTGTYAAVTPVEGGSRKVALNAIHSPENWFEDFGSGQLSGGEAVVNIESVFGETINTGVEYHVFITPNGDCKGLYVAQKSAASFVVKELGGGTSSIAFDYRIVAKRKGLEQVRLLDKTDSFSTKHFPARPAEGARKHMPSQQEMQKRIQQHLGPRPVAALHVPAGSQKP